MFEACILNCNPKGRVLHSPTCFAAAFSVL